MSIDPIEWLSSLAQFGIKFGLHNIQVILRELGDPERQFRSLHIAGTNGKGSVTAMLECALRLSGRRTGRFTSPHLLDLTERFAINGTAVSRDNLVQTVALVQGVVERLRSRGDLDVHPTFFEVTTAVGFELFRQHAVEIAVCEVGLGGRLDATNVLSPMACAITSIGFDHQRYLGSTLREIAIEKAGIIKFDTPVVVGSVGEDAATAIAERAAALHAPVIWAAEGVTLETSSIETGRGQRFFLRTPRRDYGELHLALEGTHQLHNAVVAVRLLEALEARGLALDGATVAHALHAVEWPGRLEEIVFDAVRVALVDAAHNADGAEALARHLRRLGRPRPLVFAAMADKDASAMLRHLAPVVSALIITRASNPRSADPGAVAALARDLAPELQVYVIHDVQAALNQAWSLDTRIIVAGSLFLVADVMKEHRRT